MAEVLSGGGEAAAAPVAPSAAPTAQQANGASGSDAPGARPGEVEVEAKPGRAARARLPGVVSHNDDEPWIGKAEVESRHEARHRDAQGRFTVTFPDGVEAEGKPGEKPELPPDVAKATADAATKFKFAGQEFESQEKAEQNFKSLQGMFKHKDGQIKSLTDERDYGYRAAHAWEAQAREAMAKLAKYEGGGETQVGQQGSGARVAQAGSQATAGGIPDLDAILSEVDTDAFEVLATQAGLPQAGKYLVNETLKAVLQKVVPALKAEFDSKLQPYEADREQQAAVAQAEGLVQSLISYQTPSGEQAFPELADPVKLKQIGAMWRESGLPVEHAMTPAGLMQAVAMFRLVESQQRAGTVAAPPQIQRQAEVGSPATAAAASVGEDRGGLPNGGDRNVSPEHRRLIAALADTNFIDKGLGFSTYRKERSF